MSVASDLREFVSKGQEVVLPASGITVQFRRVNLPDLAARGVLPGLLLQKALSGFPDLEKSDKSEGDVLAALGEMWQFAAIVLKDGLVSPRMVDVDPNDEEITLSDLVDEDRIALISIAQMPIKQWEPFLREERARLSSVDDGKEPTE